MASLLFAHTLLTGIDVPGYATTIVVVLFLGGIQLLVMGILGEYLAKTYIQGKHRPVYVVKNGAGENGVILWNRRKKIYLTV